MLATSAKKTETPRDEDGDSEEEYIDMRVSTLRMKLDNIDPTS